MNSYTAGKWNARMRREEGFVARPTVGPAGKLNLGYGFNLTDNGIPVPVARFWLNYLRRQLEPQARREFPGYDEMSAGRQIAIVELMYLIGPRWMRKFPKTAGYIKAGKWQAAAKELLTNTDGDGQSQFAQTHNERSREIAKMLETG